MDDFRAGRDALYVILEPGGADVLGGVGLYRRVGPDAIEIGYWTRTDRAGEGIATEAARALTAAGSNLQGVDRIEIHCDPANEASARIPQKLGYRIGSLAEADRPSPSTGSTVLQVWIRAV